jgi:hypothetical protein
MTWGFIPISQDEIDEANANREKLLAWLETFPKEFSVPWESDGKSGVDTYVITPEGIEDKWGNWLCHLPPVGSYFQALLDSLSAMPDVE